MKFKVGNIISVQHSQQDHAYNAYEVSAVVKGAYSDYYALRHVRSGFVYSYSAWSVDTRFVLLEETFEDKPLSQDLSRV